jgi:hypothetical protein
MWMREFPAVPVGFVRTQIGLYKDNMEVLYGFFSRCEPIRVLGRRRTSNCRGILAHEQEAD